MRPIRRSLQEGEDEQFHARAGAGPPVGVAALAAALPIGAAGERIDYEAIDKIKQQGLNPANSQVMEIASWLTDVNGPRLTGRRT